MPDQPVTPEPTPTATQDPQTQGDPAADEPLGAPGIKALEAEREARKAAEKSASELAAKVKSFEDAQKTEAERAAEALTEAQNAAARATTEALRWRTAAKHGISDEDAETFLTGTDEATITRQAERLAAFQKATPAGPRADLSQAASRDPGASSGPAADFARFLGAELNR